MAGIGVGVQTRGKVEEVLNEWVEKGRMTSAEAKELADRIIDAGKVEYDKAKKELSESYDDLLRKGNVVTQHQLQGLENRLLLLESQVAALTVGKQAGTPPKPERDAAPKPGGTSKGG